LNILGSSSIIPKTIDIVYVQCENIEREKIPKDIFDQMEISQMQFFPTMKSDVDYLTLK
jgi:hypothetical protein